MLVPRKIRLRYVTWRGQHWRIPDYIFDKHGWEALAGATVFVQDEPEAQIQEGRLDVYWPDRYSFLCFADTDKHTTKVDRAGS